MIPNNRSDAETLLAYQQYVVDAQIAYMQNLWPRSEGSIFKQTNTAMPKPVSLHILLEAGGVIYGSRGLHIENQYSDYDFAFSYEEHKKLFHTLMNYDVYLNSSTDYFNSAPEAGYYAFFQYEGLDPMTNKKIKVDILFLHNDEDLDVIRSSIQDLQSIPQYMLRDKKFRIDAYNKALQHRGWKVNPDLRNNRRDPRPPVVRRDSRVGSLTRGITPYQATIVNRDADLPWD